MKHSSRHCVQLLYHSVLQQLVTLNYEPAFEKKFDTAERAQKFLANYSRCSFVGICYETDESHIYSTQS